MPGRSGASRPGPRLAARPLGRGHRRGRLRRRRAAWGRPGPSPPDHPRPRACGGPSLAARLDRCTRVRCQGRRGGRARGRRPRPPACQAWAGVRPHARHGGPRLEHGAPRLPRAGRPARPCPPRPAVWCPRATPRGGRQAPRLPAPPPPQGLPGPIQPGPAPPGTRLGLGPPAAPGGPTRHPTWGQEAGPPRDQRRPAPAQRRAGGRPGLWWCLRAGCGGGPHRPQRLRRSAPARRRGASLVGAGATRWRTRHGRRDAATRWGDRCTATADLLGALSNRAPAPAQNRRGMAKPRCHRDTQHGWEPRLLGLGNTPPTPDALPSYVRNCQPEFCKNTVPGDNARKAIYLSCQTLSITADCEKIHVWHDNCP